MKKIIMLLGLLSLIGIAPYGPVGPAGVHASESTDIQMLRDQVRRLQETVGQLQNTIQTMQKDSSARGQQLEREVEQQVQQQVEAMQRRQAERMATDATSPLDRALDELGIADPQPRRSVASDGPALWRRPLGGATQLRLIDVSTDVLFFAGGSSERDEAISTLQGGAHDPSQRGFTLGQAEISLSAAVDPYFTAETHVLTSVNPTSGETTVELEEAFLKSSSLPYSLQLEAGHFLTEFGIVNKQHPHSWDWMDQPLVNSRMFGGDGMRQAGFRVSWLPPTPWFSELHVGLQNANGSTMGSFLGGSLAHVHGADGHADEHAHEEEGEEHDDEHGHEEEGEEHDHEEHGHEEELEEEGEEHDEEHDHEDAHAAAADGEGLAGRHIVNQDVRGFGDFVYLARWENSFDLSDELTAVFGASGLYGPNATGRDGDTWLYGLDMKWRWTPTDSFRGYPFLTWQTEIMKRDYHTARYVQEVPDNFSDEHMHEPDGFDPAHNDIVYPSRTLQDWGLYTQVLYGFRTNWAAGLRYEYAGGSGASLGEGGRRNDPFRDDRHRVSPLLTWRPSEFTRIRLQYNFDTATHLANDAHSLWLGFEWLYGAHPAHAF